MTINKPYSNDCSCSSSKCMGCNFRLVCASSPYCCINSSSNINKSEIYELYQKIEELEKIIIGFVNSQINATSGKLEEIKKINSNIDATNNSISELDKNMNEKIDSIQQIGNFSDMSLQDSNQIVPFSKNEEKVIVEKKGFFGKSKWVEEKK